jgi:hypothetical protein
MDAAHARTTLLAQHEAIRLDLNACAGIARRLRAGEASEAELELALDRLRGDVADHNQTESLLIRPLLDHGDDWGEQLIDRMLEEHFAEHAAMWRVMSEPAAIVAAHLEELAEDLDAHMAAEERTFLAPNVLRADVIERHRR